MAKSEPDVPTMWMQLKAPVEFFKRLDRWREQYKSEHEKVMAPSRQAAIRWIVHNFLLKQEQKAKRPRRSKTSKMRTISRAAIMAVALALLNQPAHADGLPPPQGGLYPVPVPPPGSPSCLMTALQLGYLTGRRELAYSATEACMYFTGARGVQLPYGYYGPYVPSGWVPPGWALPPPGYGR